MRRREIAAKLERIIEFAGVADFIDTPVKFYSSGMYVRLGFSIAAHLEPDILLLDEVLSVGDAAFQAKCLDRIHELHRQGRTIVFISHDLGSVERLCSRAILLQRGEVITTGAARDVIASYHALGAAYAPSDPHALASAILSREVEITAVTCHGSDGRPTAVFRTGSSVTVRLSYVTRARVTDAIFEVFVYSLVDGWYGAWCQITTASRDGRGMVLEPGEGTVEFEVDELSFLPGMYYVSATVVHEDQPQGTAIDWQNQCLALRVDPGRFIRGTFYMPHPGRPPPPPASPEPGARSQSLAS